MGFLNTLKIRREITKLTLYSINLSGVFPIKKQTTGFVRYFCICFTIFEMLYLCVLSLVEAFTRNYDFIVYVSIIVTVISCLVCFCNQVAFTFYKQALGEIIRMIDIGFYTYSDEQIETFSTKKISKKEFYICTFLLLTYAIMAFSPLFFALLLKDGEYSTSDLVYVAWPLFGIETSWQYFFTYIAQYISSFPSYMSLISKILFINYINKEYEYQSKKLRYALEKVCEGISEKETLSTTSNVNEPDTADVLIKYDEDKILRRLRDCVRHYQQLQKYVGYFSLWFNIIFSCELAYGFISFALIGYVVIQGTGNYGTEIKFVGLLGVFILEFCYQCLIGENLNILQQCHCEELYNIPWYYQTPKIRKNVLIFLVHLQHEQNLRGFKLYRSSIRIFASILRISYSYLNLLNNVVHK